MNPNFWPKVHPVFLILFLDTQNTYIPFLHALDKDGNISLYLFQYDTYNCIKNFSTLVGYVIMGITFKWTNKLIERGPEETEESRKIGYKQNRFKKNGDTELF